ncbi:TatD family hydrolase [Raoultibacter massiliensis]|uniref:TatD family hydrolase n=1 Tax=Raoultibacter massiliensis TaxID=1852371 RepID=A0ABV1JAM3_9ACTN
MPRIRIAVGCHPHNAKDYDESLEAELLRRLADPRVAALGEVGLDYHYDFSPRPVQIEVFRRQIEIAHETGLPLALHLREAHEEAFQIMNEEGFPEAGVLLHCFNLDWDTLKPWLDKGCYAAFGGSLTFKKSDDTREAARRMRLDRILTETDAPYMTPEPMRGMECGPDHVIFTAARLAEVLGCAPGPEQIDTLYKVYDNALSLLDREPTAWQREHGEVAR